MANSKLTIYNRALVKCGAPQVTTVGEGTTQDSIVGAVYDNIRDEVLMEHAWTFAQRRIALTNITAPTSTPNAWVTAHTYSVNDYVLQSGTNYICLIAHTSGTFATDLVALDWGVASATIPLTEDRMTVCYSRPSGIVKVNFTSDINARYALENLIISSTATQVILSDTLNLKIQYTYQNDDPTMYHAMFINALVSRIASEIAPSFSATRAIADDLRKEYEDIHLPRAISIDSQQSSPAQPQMDEWELARFNSGMQGTQSGRQTWNFGNW